MVDSEMIEKLAGVVKRRIKRVTARGKAVLVGSCFCGRNKG